MSQSTQPSPPDQKTSSEVAPISNFRETNKSLLEDLKVEESTFKDKAPELKPTVEVQDENPGVWWKFWNAIPELKQFRDLFWGFNNREQEEEREALEKEKQLAIKLAYECKNVSMLRELKAQLEDQRLTDLAEQEV